MQESQTRWYDRKVNTFAEIRFLSRGILEAYRDYLPAGYIDKYDGAFRSGDLARCEKMLDSMATEAVVSGDMHRYVCAASTKALFSKNEGLSNPEQCSETALRTWYKAERQCRRANRRLRLFSNHWQPKPGSFYGQQYRRMMERARTEVRRVIGDRPKLWAELCKHGGGVSIGCSGLATNASFKDAAYPYAVTESAGLVLDKLVRASKPWFELVSNDTLVVSNQRAHSDFLTLVPDRNKLAFVPKNWKTHRSICVEPLGNLYLQQGLGREIALSLKRVGINIFDDGQLKHQEYARQASKLEGVYGNGSVTLDLSMASDTLCAELVRYLLPESWYDWLDLVRCHETTLPGGEVVRTSKFSSMGNAATFPLETLIFYALAKAAVEETCHSGVVSAYGDDIVVPRGSALLLVELLRFCGFSVNADKSFIHGSFYESCGADYLGGVSVRPFYLKRDLRNVRDWYFLYNVIKRGRWAISVLGGNDSVCDRILRTLGRDVYYGPEVDHISSGVPDGWLETSESHKIQLRFKRGFWQFRSAETVASKRQLPDDVAYIETLRGSGNMSDSAIVVPIPSSSRAVRLDKAREWGLSFEGSIQMRRPHKIKPVGYHDTRNTRTVKRWRPLGDLRGFVSGN